MADEATRTAARPTRDSTAHIRGLVERAQQGERGALEELYLIHFDRIYSYLHMSVGNRHDAEDLTTQTFLKMLESIKRFTWQSAPFSAGRLRDGRRRHGRRPRSPARADRRRHPPTQGHARCDSSRRGARHWTRAARESAPGGRAARRPRRFLGDTGSRRRPGDAETRAVGRRPGSRRAPARAGHEAGEV